MKIKSILFVVIMLLHDASFVRGNYCKRVDDNGCVSYTVVCSNGVDSLQKECDNASVTFVLTNFNTNSFAVSVFTSTSSSFDSTVRVIKGSDSTWTILEASLFRFYTKVTRIDLSGNHIKHITDSTFSNLIVLENLNLSRNSIETLSAHSLTISDSSSTKLHTLDLSNNYINSIASGAFGNLKQLVTLYLNNNKLKYIDDNTFSGLNYLNYLQTLDLSCNNIKSPIESTMFMNNYRLEYLNLYNNSISEIQKSAFKHTILSYLNLERNNLKGSIGEYSFAGIKTTRLDLSNYGIETIENYAFFNSPNLVYLNISNNKIKNIYDHGITSLPSLSILDLSNNTISNVSFLHDCCKNLTELYLQHNKINVFPEHILNEYMYIKILDISMNNIVVLGHNSLPLNNLQYLSVQGNIFQGPIESGIFSPSKYISTLNLSKMNFTTIHPAAFNDLPLLARLNLSHNYISVIDPNNFNGINNLEVLDLSYNQISAIDINNAGFNNIKSIYLNHNNLVSISDFISHFNSLIFIDVSYNQIEYISNTQFDLSPNLQTLYFSHNKIDSFNNHITNKLNKLVDLKLSSNKLTNLNVSFFPQLTNLDVSNNSLSSIDKHFLHNLQHLQYLDFSINDIDDLPPGTFHEINGIKHLNFSSNKLSKIRYGSLNDLQHLEVLDISRNNIDNLDINLINECTSLKKLIIDYNRITASDIDGLVSSLPHLNIVSLGGNAMSCTEVINVINYFKHTSVYVTSIDKVYDDDNIHGIKCGPEGEMINNENNIKVTVTINFPFRTNPYRIFSKGRLITIDVGNTGSQ